MRLEEQSVHVGQLHFVVVKQQQLRRHRHNKTGLGVSTGEQPAEQNRRILTPQTGGGNKKLLHYLTDATSGEHFSCDAADPSDTNHGNRECADFLSNKNLI